MANSNTVLDKYNYTHIYMCVCVFACTCTCTHAYTHRTCMFSSQWLYPIIISFVSPLSCCCCWWWWCWWWLFIMHISPLCSHFIDSIYARSIPTSAHHQPSVHVQLAINHAISLRAMAICFLYIPAVGLLVKSPCHHIHPKFHPLITSHWCATRYTCPKKKSPCWRFICRLWYP